MEGVTKTPRGLHCLQAMGTSSPGLVMLINSQHVSDPRTQIRSNKFGNNSISERLPTNTTDYKKATVAWSLYASMAKTQYTMIDRDRKTNYGPRFHHRSKTKACPFLSHHSII